MFFPLDSYPSPPSLHSKGLALPILFHLILKMNLKHHMLQYTILMTPPPPSSDDFLFQ